jgi:ATP-dependent RNA helicase DDX18/HAS1
MKKEKKETKLSKSEKPKKQIETVEQPKIEKKLKNKKIKQVEEIQEDSEEPQEEEEIKETKTIQKYDEKDLVSEDGWLTKIRYDSLDINDNLKKSISDMGFEYMTEIQAKSLPQLLAGKDLLAQAKTGSGKTLGKFFAEKIKKKSIFNSMY